MPNNNLPTYAIVELLIRLEPHNTSIGGYKNHSFYDDGVMVKTTGGLIHFPETLVMQQFHEPELISEHALLEVSSSFNPFK